MLALAFLAAAEAQPRDDAISIRAAVTPASARIGERVRYRGQVVSPAGMRLRWLPPEESPDLTWGSLAPRLLPGQGSTAARRDTLLVEADLQAFRLGTLSIPGLRYQDARSGALRRLPAVRLAVHPVLAAADSNADLRPPRAPLAAPWWERMPWRWIALALALLAALVALFVAWRRRRRRPAPVAAPAHLDPLAEALAALGALRASRLPEQERFVEHAVELTRIVRRFLERTQPTPRPGHTTPELVRHLETARLDAPALQTLERLLRKWDRIKFAREGCVARDCTGAEEEARGLVQRLGAPAAPDASREAA